MAEETKKEEKVFGITDPDNVPVVFVSDLAGAGFLNNVINLTFVTARWTPVSTQASPDAIDIDLVVTSRLRMDMFCARHLRDQLDQFLQTAAAGGTAN